MSENQNPNKYGAPVTVTLPEDVWAYIRDAVQDANIEYAEAIEEDLIDEDPETIDLGTAALQGLIEQTTTDFFPTRIV